MVYRPATEKEPRMSAWPLASSVTRATTVLPTKNVTVPVGVPVPDGSRTVAVNVTACGREAGRERRRAAGPDGAGPQDHVAVLEGDRAGRRSARRCDGGHRG